MGDNILDVRYDLVLSPWRFVQLDFCMFYTVRLAAPVPEVAVTIDDLLPWLTDLLMLSTSRIEVFVLKKFTFALDSRSFSLPVFDLFLFTATCADIMALAPGYWR